MSVMSSNLLIPMFMYKLNKYKSYAMSYNKLEVPSVFIIILCSNAFVLLQCLT